tara:strand:- start:5411 stop:5968 length:558 start_codon:yes stop_codon:yes gene_type:complete
MTLNQMFTERDWLTIGKFVSPQGLNGKIRVNPSSDFPERFTKAGPRWIQENLEDPQKIVLLSGKQIPGKSIYIVSIEEINDRKSAESLIGKKLLVPASDRPKLKANEYHFLDLIDLEVRLNQEKSSFGKIKNLTNAGNDLLEIETNDGKRILIPFVKEIVPELNFTEGWVSITPPPGLLDLENLD